MGQTAVSAVSQSTSGECVFYCVGMRARARDVSMSSSCFSLTHTIRYLYPGSLLVSCSLCLTLVLFFFFPPFDIKYFETLRRNS